MSRSKTPTFLLELPLQVDGQQAKHLRAHFEAARCLYNALLGEAMKRLGQMRADSRWQEARRLPKACKQERQVLFSQLRQEYGFSEYALHSAATRARTSWIADHLDSNTAQKLATRAYQAANRVCLGQAKKVRFKSRVQLALEGIPHQKPTSASPEPEHVCPEVLQATIKSCATRMAE
jgi:hypothetical protein